MSLDREMLFKMAGWLAEIAYELHDSKNLTEYQREMLLEFWREFDVYGQNDTLSSRLSHLDD